MRLLVMRCLLYTSDAADERSSVDLGGRRIIKKKKNIDQRGRCSHEHIRHAINIETVRIQTKHRKDLQDNNKHTTKQ